MKQIPLTQGKFTLVNDEDYDFLMQWKWNFNGGYAVRSEYLGKVDGKYQYTKIYMHRVILGEDSNVQGDHKNRDTLDNQRHNLRLCTATENKRNVAGHKLSSSKYKGVCWNEKRGRWRASIKCGEKIKTLGYFIKEEDAAIAYNSQAEKNFGEFAYINAVAA